MTIGRLALIAAALSVMVLPVTAEAHGRRHHHHGYYRQYVRACVDIDGFQRPCRPWWQRLGHGDPAYLPSHSFRAARGGW